MVILNIIKGWYRKITNKKYDFATNRQKICERCSYREYYMGYYWCSKCGCEIVAKSNVEDEMCLDGRWPELKNE